MASDDENEPWHKVIDITPQELLGAALEDLAERVRKGQVLAFHLEWPGGDAPLVARAAMDLAQFYYQSAQDGADESNATEKEDDDGPTDN